MKCLRALLFLLSVAALIPPVIFTGLYIHHAAKLPHLAPIETYLDELKVPSTLYSAEGLVIGEYFEERRVVIPLERMPIALIQAFLAAEDERFFEHEGVDARGVLRAAWANVSAGRIVEGASTITQQLAKSMLTRQKTFDRKFQEAILARRMESIYSKKDILTLYLNQIFLGHNSYGVQAAAQNYFRKDVSELNLGEMTTLAVLPPSPSRVNPIRNMKKTMQRRKHVLNRMTRLGYITAGQAALAQKTQPTAYPLKDEFYARMPHVAEAARKKIQTRYARGKTNKDALSAWLKHGLKIYTTSELALQQSAQAAVYSEVSALDKKHGYRGPLGQVSDDVLEETLERATAYYMSRGMLKDKRLQPNHTFLAIVQSVSTNQVNVSITESINATLPRNTMKWAGTYREYPVVKGKRNERGPVSWKPRLKDCRSAFSVGDVIAVHANQSGEIQLTQPPKVQGAVLNWEPQTGYIRAMVGGSDFESSEVNRVHSLRQTASTMKPIYYGLAYATGLRTSDGISDAPYGVKGVFESDGGSSDGGAMAAWLGLAKSRNSVSGRIGDHVRNHAGLDSLKQWGEALGLNYPLKGNKAEVFGGDQTLYDMSTAYGTFQNNGLFTRPNLIRKVVDKDNNVVVDHSYAGDSTLSLRDSWSALYRQLFYRKPRTMSEGVAFIMRHNLRGVVTQGTARRARNLKPVVAGKTGSLPYDIWFNGFSGDSVITAWVGYDRRERPVGRSKNRSGVYGSSHPLSVFIEVMKASNIGRKPKRLLKPIPGEIKLVRVDPRGEGRKTKGGIRLPHLAGNVPQLMFRGENSSDNIDNIDDEF